MRPGGRFVSLKVRWGAGGGFTLLGGTTLLGLVEVYVPFEFRTNTKNASAPLANHPPPVPARNAEQGGRYQRCSSSPGYNSMQFNRAR